MNIGNTSLAGVLDVRSSPGDSAATPAGPRAPDGGSAAGAAAVATSDSGELPSAAQAASADLQTASSFVQTAAAAIGQIHGILAQMERASAASSSAFSGLQRQLRGTVGGAPHGIGGAEGASAQGAEFAGVALFGPGNEEAAAPLQGIGVNLRQGAVLGLIQQDQAGNFTLGASDAKASASVSAAMQQVSVASDSLGAFQDAIRASAAAMGGGEGAPSVASSSEASAATLTVVGFITDQSEAALTAIAGGALRSCAGLL